MAIIPIFCLCRFIYFYHLEVSYCLFITIPSWLICKMRRFMFPRNEAKTFTGWCLRHKIMNKVWWKKFHFFYRLIFLFSSIFCATLSSSLLLPLFLILISTVLNVNYWYVSRSVDYLLRSLFDVSSNICFVCNSCVCYICCLSILQSTKLKILIKWKSMNLAFYESSKYLILNLSGREIILLIYSWLKIIV